MSCPWWNCIQRAEVEFCPCMKLCRTMWHRNVSERVKRTWRTFFKFSMLEKSFHMNRSDLIVYYLFILIYLWPFQDVEDADWLPPWPVHQQHADAGQEDLRLHRPAGLHQRWNIFSSLRFKDFLVNSWDCISTWMIKRRYSFFSLFIKRMRVLSSISINSGLIWAQRYISHIFVPCRALLAHTRMCWM